MAFLSPDFQLAMFTFVDRPHDSDKRSLIKFKKRSLIKTNMASCAQPSLKIDKQTRRQAAELKTTSWAEVIRLRNYHQYGEQTRKKNLYTPISIYLQTEQ